MPVKYRGSPYHKRYPSPWGQPELRSDKDECPVDIPVDEAATVLASAIDDSIRAGWVSQIRDGAWPRYVWGRSEFRTRINARRVLTWEARVENRGVPEYKAYPITRKRHSDHMPAEVEELLWPS